MHLKKILTPLAAILLLTTAHAYGQNRFDGYSLTVEANNDGLCPLRYLPSAGGGNAIEIFVAGTNQSVKATGITACNGSSMQGTNKTFTNGDGRWCFQGSEPMYEIKLTNGAVHLWYPTTSRDTGFYNLKDFRPVTRSGYGKYNFTEPADYSRTFRNAVTYIAARQGGTLQIPDGDYILGTLDGERRDPNYQAITLPTGINVVGAGANLSVANTNLPNRLSPTRIRLRHPNQTIFRIGGCTNQVTVKDLELHGNSAVYGEPQRDTTGNYGIEGLGKWAKDARGEFPNSSQLFKFENVTFQNLDKGIYVHNINDDNCRPNEQVCKSWQFDYVKVDHGFFINNKTGIFVDTGNTDWTISNSVFYYIASNAPGDGIRVKNGGSMLIQQTWGGGYDYGASIGGTFLNIDTIGTLTIINSGGERGQRALYTNPLGMLSNVMITMIGGGFGDKVELHGYVNFISTGNMFGANAITADPTVTITSTGDRFCYDARLTACTDRTGRVLNRPDFNGGRMMFQTGRLPEGSGPSRIEGKSNVFGYNVELRDGLMQYDPNVTYQMIQNWAAGRDGRPPVQDGAIVYCKDCIRGPECRQGSAGRDGAFAKRINGRWMCD